jgi:hypothetical protein
LLRSCQKISPGPRHFQTFHNNNNFYSEGLLAPCPTPKLEDHPLSAVRDAYSMYSQLHSVPGGLPSIRNLRTRHEVVTRDPPNMERRSTTNKMSDHSIRSMGLLNGVGCVDQTCFVML